jgi:hypothetical protein
MTGGPIVKMKGGLFHLWFFDSRHDYISFIFFGFATAEYK